MTLDDEEFGTDKMKCSYIEHMADLWNLLQDVVMVAKLSSFQGD